MKNKVNSHSSTYLSFNFNFYPCLSLSLSVTFLLLFRWSWTRLIISADLCPGTGQFLQKCHVNTDENEIFPQDSLSTNVLLSKSFSFWQCSLFISMKWCQDHTKGMYNGRSFSSLCYRWCCGGVDGTKYPVRKIKHIGEKVMHQAGYKRSKYTVLVTAQRAQSSWRPCSSTGGIVNVCDMWNTDSLSRFL